MKKIKDIFILKVLKFSKIQKNYKIRDKKYYIMKNIEKELLFLFKKILKK